MMTIFSLTMTTMAGVNFRHSGRLFILVSRIINQANKDLTTTYVVDNPLPSIKSTTKCRILRLFND